MNITSIEENSTRAIFAYQQAVPFREPPYFDKALYKLAWSFYRSDRFVDAVKHFDELVVLADQKKLGEPGKRRFCAAHRVGSVPGAVVCRA